LLLWCAKILCFRLLILFCCWIWLVLCHRFFRILLTLIHNDMFRLVQLCEGTSWDQFSLLMQCTDRPLARSLKQMLIIVFDRLLLGAPLMNFHCFLFIKRYFLWLRGCLGQNDRTLFITCFLADAVGILFSAGSHCDRYFNRVAYGLLLRVLIRYNVREFCLKLHAFTTDRWFNSLGWVTLILATNMLKCLFTLSLWSGVCPCRHPYDLLLCLTSGAIGYQLLKHVGTSNLHKFLLNDFILADDFLNLLIQLGVNFFQLLLLH